VSLLRKVIKADTRRHEHLILMYSDRSSAELEVL